MGISTRQKVAAAVRFLATGSSFDDLDDRYRMGETTLRETVKRFCINIQSIYTSHHLRPPNKEDLEKLLKVSEGQGWPGMLGSLDCSHYRWKNCPVVCSFLLFHASIASEMLLCADDRKPPTCCMLSQFVGQKHCLSDCSQSLHRWRRRPSSSPE